MEQPLLPPDPPVDAPGPPARSSNAPVGRMPDGVMHDLDNVLTRLCLNVHFALHAAQDAAALTEALEDMRQALRDARDLAAGLRATLPLARKAPPTVSLRALITETTRFTLRGTRVSCDLSAVEELPPVTLDDTGTRRILQNLLINAEQASPNDAAIRLTGTVVTLDEVRATADGCTLEPGRYVHLRVEDEGCGIAPDMLERVFEPGFTTRETGSGLGLPVCRAIAQQCGGHLEAEARTSGTSMRLWLPVRSAKPARLANEVR